MDESLRCYWCGHHPVKLSMTCPSCGEYLTEIVPFNVGSGFVDRAYTRAWKEMMLAEDRKCLSVLTDILYPPGSLL